MKPIHRIACALVGALAMTGAAAAQAPDAIYYNAKVVTADEQFSIRDAFAVRGDTFLAVGSGPEIRALAANNTRLVDLKGATVIPGLSDNHDHFWNAGRYLIRGVDLVGVTSLAEMQARLRVAVAAAKPGEVVFTTTGWAIQPAVTRKDLDAVSATVPIVAIANRRGTGVLNSAALAKAGVTKENPVYKGARLKLDDGGELLGTPPAYPQNVMLIESLLPPLTAAQQDEIVRQAQAQRHALGITSVRELALWPDAVKALQRIRKEGKLTLRMTLGLEFPDQENTAKHLAALPAPTHTDRWLSVDSLSEEPWTPGVVPVEQFTDLSITASRLGWRMAPHVNSDPARGRTADEATDMTLQAFEAVDRDRSLNGRRWYVEHVPRATPEQMDRMARLGLIVSTQSAGYLPDHYPALSPERMAHQNPIRGFLDRKLIVIGGSDYNGPNAEGTTSNNPLIPFYYYVTRKPKAGAVTTASEKISREEALRIFTTNAAYASFEESVKGAIKAGMLADFVVLNQDLMTVPDEQILATRPLATYVGGKRVYAAPGSAPP